MNPIVVDKCPKVPVILLRSLTIDGVIARELGCPVRATLSILAKYRNASIEISFAKSKGVSLCSLDRPLAYEDGELSTAGFLFCVGAELGWKIGGRSVWRMLVVVDMNVKYEVGIVRYLVVPVIGAFKTALEHDRDLGIDFGNPVENGVDILRHPCGAIVGQDSRGAEVRHGLLVEVGWFVQGCDSIGFRGTRVLDEVNDIVDDLKGLIQSGLVIEPVPMTHGFSDRQTIESSREGMNIDNDMHPVVRDGMIRNTLQVSCLVTRVQLRARKVDPRRIVCRNTQDSDPTLRQAVDIPGGDEGGIAMLENRTTPGTKVLAECPFIRRVTAITSPESAVNAGLLD